MFHITLKNLCIAVFTFTSFAFFALSAQFANTGSGFVGKAEAATERHYGDISAVMVSNYDGDTITVNIPTYPALVGDHISVRINGIDTAELHGTTGDTHAKAVQAKAIVAAACPVGSTITLKNVGRDKYFRIDAEVVCGDTNVGQKLIDAGLAHPYDGGTKTAW
jgi:micrococcal nuclease